jgi:hypothetical protein
MGTIDQMTPETRRFYTVSGLPSQTSTSTDASGYGGFINITPGIRAVSGTRMVDNLFIGTISVLVRPGFFSYSLLAPQPFPAM